MRWFHRRCETQQIGLVQQTVTLQGIIQNQQETINRLQNAVDNANERYNSLVKDSMSQRWPTVLNQDLFNDQGDTKEAEWLTPKPQEIEINND